MKYSEARETYKTLFKSYPEVTNLWSEDEDKKEITCTIKHYQKKGSRWIETESKTEQINYIFYWNTVDPRASRFMRNLGGYERTTLNYTKKGYIPVECISISPDRTEKTVRTFTF